MCLLLVLYYVVGSNGLNGLRIADGLLRDLNDALVCLRMLLFALLAGLSYGLGRRRAMPALAFAGHQGRRLLIPMLTVGTAFALLQAATPMANGEARNWALLHWEPVAHLWFLPALFWVLLVLHGLVRSGAVDRPSGLLLCWLAAALCNLLWRGPRWLGIEGAVYLLPYALAGLALAHGTLAEQARRGLVIALLAVLVLLSLPLLWPPQPDPDRRQPAMLLAGTGLCLLLVAWRPQQPALARLGQHAYAVFLFHPFFTAATRIVLERLPGVPLGLLLLGGVAAGVAGPLLLARALRPHPWAAWMWMGEPLRPGSAHHAPERGWRADWSG